MSRAFATFCVAGLLTAMFGSSAASALPSCPTGLMRDNASGLCAAPINCNGARIRDASGACVCPGGTVATSASGTCRDPRPCPADQVRDFDTRQCGCTAGRTADAKGVCRAPCPSGQIRDPKTSACIRSRR